MHATLANKEHWPEWEKDVDNILEECREGVELLAAHFDYKEVASFKNNLLEISIAVAMAYREFCEKDPLKIKIRMYTDLYIDRIMAAIMRRPAKSEEDSSEICPEMIAIMA